MCFGGAPLNVSVRRDYVAGEEVKINSFSFILVYLFSNLPVVMMAMPMQLQGLTFTAYRVIKPPLAGVVFLHASNLLIISFS